MTKSKAQDRPRARSNGGLPAGPAGSGNRWFIGLVAVVLVVGALAVAVLASNRTTDVAAEQTADVTITGDELAPLPPGVQLGDSTTDPVAGAIAPTLRGTDFDGNEITIEPDGRPKAIYFLAHWCPHCQAEVPTVQELMADGRLPDGLDVYAVSTGVDASRGNYPPERWLADEGFQPPTIRDDDQGSAFAEFGGSSFPYAVYLDAEHRVVARSAGQLGEEAIASLWTTTAG